MDSDDLPAESSEDVHSGSVPLKSQASFSINRNQETCQSQFCVGFAAATLMPTPLSLGPSCFSIMESTHKNPFFTVHFLDGGGSHLPCLRRKQTSDI